MFKTSIICTFVFATLLLGTALGTTRSTLSPDTSQPTSFRREVIRVEPLPGSLLVTGIYYFVNESAHDVTPVIFYPFPTDSRHPFPGRITVLTASDTLSWSRSENGVHFNVAISEGSETVFTVIYEQKCLDNSGCYILTTTRAWNRPLVRAEFEIVLADSLRLQWMSYTPDDTLLTERGRVLRFTRTSFLPEKDLCLRWRILRR